MPESITATRVEILAAVAALAGLLGYLLRELFKNNQEEKKQITTAYLSHVQEATIAMTSTANSMREMAGAVNNNSAAVNSNSQMIQRLCETTQVEHAAVLSVLGLDPDRHKQDALKGGRRKSDKQEKTDE